MEGDNVSADGQQLGLEDVIASPDAVRRYERISKELKKLQFANPGPQMRGASVDTRFRVRAQGQQRTVACPSEDVPVVPQTKECCDCLCPTCPGCFLPCAGCGSNKCGVECQTTRSWDYVREYSRDHLCTGTECSICKYYTQ